MRDKIPYSEYLHTAHWLNVRKKKLHAQPWCQLCGAPEELNVHHNQYNPFHEEDRDLTVLCKGCHDKFHNILDRNICTEYGAFWPTVRMDDGRVIRHQEQLEW